MLLIKFIIAILTVLFSGHIILKLLCFKKYNLFESIALSFGLGAGFIGIVMFFLSLVGISFSARLVILPVLVLLFIYSHKFKTNFSQIMNWRKSFRCRYNFSFFESILTAFIIFEIIHTLLNAGSLPFVAWDAWCTWGFKAKMLFIDGTFNFKEWLRSPNIPHLNYPLLLPLQEAYIYIFLGKIYEPFTRIFCFFYFAGFISLFYGYLCREFSRKLSLIICFILSTTPILLKESVSGYADIPLAFYVFLSVINLRHYLNKNENSRLWLSVVFLGFGMWMKNEGFSFWLAIVLSLILVILTAPKLFKQKTKLILANIFVPLFIFSPWIILRIILNIKNEIPFKPINTILQLINERLFIILKILFFALVKTDLWNIFWFVFLFSIILLILYKKNIEFFLCFVILFQSVFFLGVFILGPSTLGEMIEWCKSSIHRPLLQIYPIVLFFIAQCLGIFSLSSKIANKNIDE